MSSAIFWSSLVLIVYAYVGYPVLVKLLARRVSNPPSPVDFTPAMTVVIAAYNESARIEQRIENILAQDYPAAALSIVVVSDGSSDDTGLIASRCRNTRSVSLAQNGGKAMAVNAAMDLVTTEFVVFTDVRQRFAPDALRRLVAAFADASVGAVSGELEFERSSAAASRPADIGLYWRMEKALRADEARIGWLHGVSGAIYALRRDLFRPMPAGLLLDDMWMPLHTVFSGKRVRVARDAIAVDIASARGVEEFRRKVRTLAGNWQLMALLPRVLNPLANSVFFAWFSHKFLRLVVPWALLAAWAASALADGALYHLAWLAQTAAYVAASFALILPRTAARIPLLPAAGTFLMLNTAALLALPAWLALDRQALWKKH